MNEALLALGCYSAFQAIDYMDLKNVEEARSSEIHERDYHTMPNQDFKPQAQYTSKINCGRKARERGPRL